jgi:hypothetical protein
MARDIFKVFEQLLVNLRRSKVLKSITVDGVEYVPKDSVSAEAPSMKGLPYRIVRTYSAGVFAGYVKKLDGQHVVLLNARRLWYWSGAASLSQLANDGVKTPGSCKFPAEVAKIELTQAIEILDVTEKAKKSIDGVAIWKV